MACFLLPAGKRVAGKLGIFLQRFLVQNIYICLFPVDALPGLLCGTASACGCDSPPAPDKRRFSTASSGLVGAFHAHIVLLCFPDLFVELARDQMDGSFPDSLEKLWKVAFSCPQRSASRSFSGIRVNDRLPDLFLWDIGLRLICSGRSFLRFTDRLFQCRIRPFLISKSAGAALYSNHSPSMREDIM